MIVPMVRHSYSPDARRTAFAMVRVADMTLNVFMNDDICTVMSTPTAITFFFSSRRRHTRCLSDWNSDVCSSDLFFRGAGEPVRRLAGHHSEAARAEHCVLHSFHSGGDVALHDDQLLLRGVIVRRHNAFRHGFHEIGRASCRERG